MANDVGRPSQLDDEQFLLKIKEMVLDNINEKEIAKILDIPIGTWDYWKWKNYQGFADTLLSYKHERMIRKAEANLEVLQESEDERVNLQANTFVLETLNKGKFSKRSELTGKDGKDLPTPILGNVQLNNSTSENNSTN